MNTESGLAPVERQTGFRRLVILGLLVALTVSASMVPIVANSQDQSMESLREQQNIDQGLQSLKEMRALVDRRSASFRYGCLRAFGSSRFCECIVTNTPTIVDFQRYILFTTEDRSELEKLAQSAGKPDPDHNTTWMEIVEATVQVRDRCVRAGY